MINKEHKDRLFCFLFGSESNKEWTLSLYNAVNGTDHRDADDILFQFCKEYFDEMKFPGTNLPRRHLPF